MVTQLRPGGALDSRAGPGDGPAVATRPPLRLGLVGCGQVTAQKHLPALRQLPEVAVVAVADRDPGRCRQVADRFGIAGRYPDVRALLAGAAVDAVGVCVPTPAHLEVAEPVLEAGKHLLVEKPIALTLPQAGRLVELAGRARGTVMVGHHFRWHRLVRQARAVVRSGRLGRLETIRSVWNSPTADAGLPAWRACRELGGGALIEIAVHHFDLWRFVLDTEVDQVFAWTRSDRRHDEAAVVTARLANGMLASAVFSERAGVESEFEIAGHDARLRAACLRFEGFGVYPTARAPGDATTRLGRVLHGLRELPAGLREWRRGGDYTASYREQWRHFARAARDGAPAECTPEDGRRALRIALAAVESALSGRPAVP